MANLAQIQSIAQGQFFVKDSLGNLTELKVGDTVSLNDTIVAASSNTDLSKIEILFDTNELITLSQGEQLLDATLLASTFGNEELAFDKQEVDETLNAWNNAQDGDATDMETAAGDVTEQATNAGNEEAADGGALRSKFNSRDGDATDIVSDLRAAPFGGATTQEPQEQIPTELLNPQIPTTTVIPTTPEVVDTRVEASIVTLNNPTVDEGKNITITATVDNAPQTDLVITLNNGEKITIKAGEISGSTTFTNPNSEDVYVDNSTETYTIIETDGGNYKDLDTTDSSTVTIIDTIDETKITLTGSEVKEGEKVVITATVEKPVTGSDLVITLDNGEKITIPVGESTGEVEYDSRADDVYVQGTDSKTVSITETSGGNFEALDKTSTATVTVKDDSDVTKITLTGSEVKEGEKVVITATVEKPVTGSDLVITLDNGEKITIPVGESTGEVEYDSRADDVYVQGTDSKTVSITETSGGNFEALDKTSTATVTVKDDSDVTKITLTGSEVKEGEKVVITATVEKPVTGSDLVITLDNGEKITIPVGESTGEVEYDSRADDVYVQGTDSKTVSITETSGGNFEALDKTSTATVTVKDDIDPIDVTITATVTTPKIIDVNTKTDGTTGVKVTGINSDGKIVDLSVIKGTNHDGFGVEGKNLSNGDTKELGVGEKIVVEFTNGKDVNSLDVSFAWRNNHETAKLKFFKGTEFVGYATVDGDGKSTTKAIIKYYDENNNLIKEVNAKGSSDKVDEAFTFELPDSNGEIVSFDKVEFSAPSNKDDYLINKIVYKEVIDPTVTDIITDGGNVTFNIQVDEKYPPQGKAYAYVSINGGDEIKVELNATGRGTLTIDSKELGDLSKVVAKVIRVDGGKYEQVKEATKEFDFTPSLKTTDDSITTNEDVPYTLTINDFGDITGISTKTEFKITELPTNGKLFLTVIKGETIFNKDGSQTVATEDSKVEVSKGQVISLAQVGAGKVEFVPNKDTDEDGSFKFQVGDGNGKFSEEYKTEIDVKAVADKPEASVGIKEIIVSTTNEVKNLGINLNASQSNGNGGNKTSSHKIDLGESISSVNINVSKVENGVVRFYDNNGNQVGQTVSIGSINGSYAPGNGLEFSSFEVVNLGGQGKGTAAFKFDGYSYTSTASDKVTYEIEYSAKLTDTDGSEKLSDFIIKNLPEGSKLFGADKQEVLANSDGTYTLKVDENGKAKLTLESQDKLSEDELNSIKASATSNEVNENGEVTDSATTTASSKLGQDIDLTGLKNILEGQKTGDIDLSKNGSQDKLTLTLDDVLKLSGDDNKIKISGDMFDSVALKNENGNDWTKSQSTITEDNKTFDVYTNSGDSTVQVKVEQPISDGITN